MIIDVRMENVSGCEHIPDESAIHQWVTATLSGHKKPMELNIRIIDEDFGEAAESACLEKRRRARLLPIKFNPSIASHGSGDCAGARDCSH